MSTYNITTFCVSMALLGYVYFFELAKLRRDNYRSEIRRIRDGLFDFMWQNGLDFNDPAYVRAPNIERNAVDV